MLAPNDPTGPAARSQPSLRRWAAVAMVLVGAVILIYPFLPSWRYSIAKPKPIIPYQTKLTAATLAQQAGATAQLPTIGHQPIPKDNRIVIPAIGVDMPIIEGPDERSLDRGGIWHIPKTSDPLKGGNMVLSGHRWRYLPPSNATLYLLDKVKDGDLMIIYWQGLEYDYRVSSREIVTPDRVDILDHTDQPRLTVFTCTPLFSTKQRLVLYGQLIP